MFCAASESVVFYSGKNEYGRRKPTVFRETFGDVPDVFPDFDTYPLSETTICYLFFMP
jgi:hypothetical protein